MDWLKVLGLMCSAGAFGGILDVLQLIDIRKLIEPSTQPNTQPLVLPPQTPTVAPVFLSKKRFVAALLLGAIGGIGGAIAMLFVIVATAKLDTSDLPANKLMLISLGMISGFLGYRVLGGVARRVEKQVEEAEARTEKKIEQTEKKIEKTVARIEERTEEKIVQNKISVQREVDYSDAITTGKIVQDNPKALPSAHEDAINKLKAVLDKTPDDRQATLILANIHAKMGDYQQGIKILSDFLILLESRGEGRNKDIADVLYNRACFYSMLVREQQESAKKIEFIGKVYADLERSFRLSPKNKEEAVNDRDFEHLANEEVFRRLTA